MPIANREVWFGVFELCDQEAAVRAGELASEVPTVSLSTPAIEAARLMANQNMPGLVVVDEANKPVTILAGTQVLQMVVPAYYQDDPTLARVISEAHADQFMQELEGRTVKEVLSEHMRELPVVEPDATVLELAALMVQTRVPLAAVVDSDGTLTGVVTLDELLDRMLAS